MESLSADLLSLLQYLLPGFLAAWVFYAFTSYAVPSQFERIVQALILTLPVQTVVFLTKILLLFIGKRWAIAPWTDQSALVTSTIAGVFVGFVLAYYANNDSFHKKVRELGISRETSYPSEWYGTFSNCVTYVVLHLKDERRLYGWPVEWPSQADEGHFALSKASWLVNGSEVALANVEYMLIDVDDVKWVEFVKRDRKE